MTKIKLKNNKLNQQNKEKISKIYIKPTYKDEVYQ